MYTELVQGWVLKGHESPSHNYCVILWLNAQCNGITVKTSFRFCELLLIPHWNELKTTAHQLSYNLLQQWCFRNNMKLLIHWFRFVTNNESALIWAHFRSTDKLTVRGNHRPLLPDLSEVGTLCRASEPLFVHWRCLKSAKRAGPSCCYGM